VGVSFEFRLVTLKKRYPLAISRGISSGSNNLFVLARDGDLVGTGEGAAGGHYSEADIEASLDRLPAVMTAEVQSQLLQPDGIALTRLASIPGFADLPAPVRCAVEVSLWDLMAQQAGLPLFQLLGLPRSQVQSSVTIGLNPSELLRERIPEILSRTGARSLKIKLGSPEGLDRDREQFSVSAEVAAPFGVKLRVDANGGWDLNQAIEMIDYVAQRGCDYVEQPMLPEEDEFLGDLRDAVSLPIFVDESVQTARDVVRLADHVNGINLKLMKTGGISEALALVATARACRLKTMIGCMGESSVAIAAGAALGSLFDHIDLDSHLNLDPDPAEGLGWDDGRLVPARTPGHGTRLKANA